MLCRLFTVSACFLFLSLAISCGGDDTGKKNDGGTTQPTSSCTSSGDINKFTITCTKDIQTFGVGGIQSGQTVKMGNVEVEKKGARTLEGKAPGESKLDLTIKHSDASSSTVTIK